MQYISTLMPRTAASALLLATTLWLAVNAALAAPLDWSGELSSRLDYRLPEAERGWAQQKLKLKFSLGQQLDSGASWTAVGRGYIDPYYRQARFADTDAHELSDDLWLHELYWRDDSDSWSWTLGKQQVTWGEADYFRVLDVVNPQDLSDYLLSYVEEFNQARHSLWMANIEWSGERWTQQWLWIPDFAATTLPADGSDFASAGIRAFQKLRDQADVREPGHALRDHSFGWRGSYSGDAIDVSLYGYYRWNPDPLLQLDSQGLHERYARRQVIGSSFSRAIDAWVVRGDAGLYLNEAVADSNGVQHRGNLAKALLALDYNGASYSLSLQALWGDGLSKPDWQSKQRMLSLYGEKRLHNDDLVLSNLAIVDLAGHSGLNEVQASYRLGGDVKVAVGSDLFWGDQALFSGYRNQNRVFIKGSYYW